MKKDVNVRHASRSEEGRRQAKYLGKTSYFCSAGCKRKFEDLIVLGATLYEITPGALSCCQGIRLRTSGKNSTTGAPIPLPAA